jgi:gliding motility-associated-like protein
MYYECTGTGSYDFTMKLYRDCFSTGADFDNPGNFAVFDQNNQLVQVITATVQTVQNINTSVASPCMVLPPNVCVEEGTYFFSLTVGDPTQSYKVVYQRCCRNGTIQNLTLPGTQGLSIVSTIPPDLDLTCNSSPAFTNFPPPVLCAQELLEFDHSAIDPDGDSLAYTLCSPFIGGSQADPLPLPPSNPPYNGVQWAPTYGPETPLAGNPSLSIDPVTGLLSGVPTQLGQYVIGVCVEEWRNGQLLSVNTRDFQFNVAVCEPPSDAVIEIPQVGQLCQGLTVNFTSTSAISNIFFWDFGDDGAANSTSSLVNPSYTFSDTGTFEVTLITNPGFFCSDTVSTMVPIFYSAQITAILDGFECINDELVYAFSSTGVYEEGAPVVWNFGPNANVATANGEAVEGVIFDGPGPHLVEVEVVNDLCSASDLIEVVAPPPIALSMQPQTEFCVGYTYSFSQESENATSFLWDFGVGNDGGLSTQPNPAFTFPGDGVYTVSVTASAIGSCPVTVEEVFEINSLLSPEVPEFSIQCYDGHSFDFSAQGDFTGSADFDWQFENGLPESASSAGVNGVIFLEPGTHPFSLTIAENGCERIAEGSVTLHLNPTASFEASPRRGCSPLEVYFQNLSSTQSTNASFTWEFGDGSPSAPFAPSHTFYEPGIYTVSLRIDNLNGCIDSDEQIREAYIEVLPTPRPGFTIDPIVVSAFDPVIEISDASVGGGSCIYFFDGQEFNGCNFSHSLNNLSPQTITQRVTNGEGCTAEISRNLRVSDHLIYVPNAFTPNGDGLNDFFAPVLTGAARYDMYIMDRWGKEVYAEENADLGWNGGDRSGSHFVAAGLYQYMIIVTDYSGWRFEYAGHITVSR